MKELSKTLEYITSHKELVCEMDSMIRTAALRGNEEPFDLDHGDQLFWVQDNDKLLVYFESFFQEEYGFRLFVHADGYEKKLIISPTYGTDIYQCAYEHITTAEGKTKLLYIAPDLQHENTLEGILRKLK